MMDPTEQFTEISMAFSAEFKRRFLVLHRIFLKYKYLHTANLILCVTLLFLFSIHYPCIYMYRYILSMYLVFAILFFCFSLNPLPPHNIIYYGLLLFCTGLWGHKDAPCKVSALRECGWTQLHRLTSDPISISHGGQAAQPEGSQGSSGQFQGRPDRPPWCEDSVSLKEAIPELCVLSPSSSIRTKWGHITWDAPLAALVSGTLTHICVWFSGPLASRQW